MKGEKMGKAYESVDEMVYGISSWRFKIRWFIHKLFWFKCPDCSGKLVVEFLDMDIDKFVYQCVDCKKEWI